MTRDPECRACGAKLVWALSTKTLKVAPITAEPKDNGNVLLFRQWPNGEPTYAILTPVTAGILRKLLVPLRLSHFADCPNADEFRKGQSS